VGIFLAFGVDNEYLRVYNRIKTGKEN